MKVIKVEGRDEFVKKLTQANQQMEGLLKQILSEDALKQMADPTFGIVPPKPSPRATPGPARPTLNLGPIGCYKGSTPTPYEGQDDKNKDLAKISSTTTLTYQPPTDPAGQAAVQDQRGRS